jgi:PAS domain S-box-containing protein
MLVLTRTFMQVYLDKEVIPIMSRRKPYTPPRVNRYQCEPDYPDWTKSIVKSLRQELKLSLSSQCEVKPEYVTVVDSDRKYVEVSNSFCQLVGYQREELLGMRYDDLTAPNTNDIPSVYSLFSKLGYMHGLWMLVSHEGTRILVRYESWLRPDSYIEGHMEVVGAGY